MDCCTTSICSRSSSKTLMPSPRCTLHDHVMIPALSQDSFIHAKYGMRADDGGIDA